MADLMHTWQNAKGEPWRTCHGCLKRYAENVAEDNPEARCPYCGASQALCVECNDPGGETCIRCDQEVCASCWQVHRGDDAVTPCPG